MPRDFRFSRIDDFVMEARHHRSVCLYHRDMNGQFSSWQRRCGVLTRASRIAARGALTVAAPALTTAAEPGPSAWFETDQGKVRLIAAAPTTGPGATARLGLEFRLAPGWKVYWRSPGDAG